MGVDIKTIKECYELAMSYPTMLEAADDWRFMIGDNGSQWDPQFAARRRMDNLPVLQMNRIPQFTRLVANTMREQPVDIKIGPKGVGATRAKAELRAAKIRDIQEKSNAQIAYQMASQAAATGGFGWVKVGVDYESPKSFSLDIQVLPVLNWQSILCDPGAKHPTAKDARWQIELEDVLKKDYEASYGAAPSSSFASSLSTAAFNNGYSEQLVTLATYWYREDKKAKLIRLVSGETIVAPSAAGIDRELIAEIRNTTIPTVRWARSNGHEIIEEGEFPSSDFLPFVRFVGEHFMLDGRQYQIGVTRYSKDSQQALNYLWSKQVEAIGLAPKAPIVAAVGQLTNFEKDWNESSWRATPYLLYNPVSSDGTLLPPPHRLNYTTDIQALMLAARQAEEGMKTTAGVPDAAFGVRSNEQSGIAISQRSQQGDRANYHLYAHAKIAIKQTGYVINSMLGTVYHEEGREVTVLSEDEKLTFVVIGQPIPGDESGEIVDFAVGEYDVSITAGPSFPDRRAEAQAGLMALVQTAPQTFPLIGDIIVENMGIPGAPKLAKRLHSLVPPEARDEKTEIPPQVMQHLQQQGELIERLTETVKVLQTEKDFKTLELQSRERIEAAKIEADMAKAQAQYGTSMAIEELRADMNRIQAMLPIPTQEAVSA